MVRSRFGLAALAASLLAGCSSLLPGPDIGSSHHIGTVQVLRSDGVAVGRLRVDQSFMNARLRLDVRGLPPGIHGVHIHQTGRCDPPGFGTAGAHWDMGPVSRHGRAHAEGSHEGDLGNISVPATGRLKAEFNVTPGAFFPVGNTLWDADGSALVIHALPDDERTEPEGNSGARIACAVVPSIRKS